jgi:hypothetical protein
MQQVIMQHSGSGLGAFENARSKQYSLCECS